MQAAGEPLRLYWGCQNRVWFGSLPTMTSFTVGNVRATCAANCAKRPAAAVELPTARGVARSSTNSTLMPRACANGSMRSISAWSRIVIGVAGSQRIVIRTSLMPTSLIWPKKNSGSAPLAWSSTTPICRSAPAGLAKTSAAQNALRATVVSLFTRAGFRRSSGRSSPRKTQYTRPQLLRTGRAHGDAGWHQRIRPDRAQLLPRLPQARPRLRGRRDQRPGLPGRARAHAQVRHDPRGPQRGDLARRRRGRDRRDGLQDPLGAGAVGAAVGRPRRRRRRRVDRLLHGA